MKRGILMNNIEIDSTVETLEQLDEISNKIMGMKEMIETMTKEIKKLKAHEKELIQQSKSLHGDLRDTEGRRGYHKVNKKKRISDKVAKKDKDRREIAERISVTFQSRDECNKTLTSLEDQIRRYGDPDIVSNINLRNKILETAKVTKLPFVIRQNKDEGYNVYDWDTFDQFEQERESGIKDHRHVIVVFNNLNQPELKMVVDKRRHPTMMEEKQEDKNVFLNLLEKIFKK